MSSLQKYKKVAMLGEGAFAKVYLVRNNEDQEVYALKAISKQIVLETNQEKSIMSQKKVLSQISHPFLVSSKEYFQDRSKLYFILDYCPGGELFRILSQKDKLPEPQCKFIAAQILLAIQALHQHDIIYCDLKPQNVLIDSQGYVKITDFGLAKDLKEDEEEQIIVCGTPEFLAPQLLKGQGYTKAIDWWCLGCIIYEMVTGAPPFNFEDRKQLFTAIIYEPFYMPDVSPAMKDIMFSLLQKNPKERLGTKGAAQVRNHQWFTGIDWEQLQNKSYGSPFVPELVAKDDLSHFDEEFTKSVIEEHKQEQEKIKVQETLLKEPEQNGENASDIPPQRRRRRSQLIQGLPSKTKSTQENSVAPSEEVPLKNQLKEKQPQQKQDEELAIDNNSIVLGKVLEPKEQKKADLKSLIESPIKEPQLQNIVNHSSTNPIQKNTVGSFEEAPLKKQSSEKELTSENNFMALGKVPEPKQQQQKKVDFNAFGEQAPIQKVKVDETQQNAAGLNGKVLQRQRRKSQLVQGLFNKTKPIQVHNVGVFDEVSANPGLAGKAPDRQRRKSQLVQGLANKTKPIQVNKAGVFDEVPLNNQSNKKQEQLPTTNNTLTVVGKVMEPVKKKKKSDFSAFGEQIPIQRVRVDEIYKRDLEPQQNTAGLNGKVPQRQRRKSQLVQGLFNKTKTIQVNNAGVFEEAPPKQYLKQNQHETSNTAQNVQMELLDITKDLIQISSTFYNLVPAERKTRFIQMGYQMVKQYQKVIESKNVLGKVIERKQQQQTKVELNPFGLTTKAPQRQRRKSQLVQGLFNKTKPIQVHNVGVFEEAPLKQQLKLKDGEQSIRNNSVVLGKVIEPKQQRQKIANSNPFGDQISIQKTKEEEPQQSMATMIGLAPQRRRRKSQLVQGLANKTKSIQVNNVGVFDEVPQKQQLKEKEDGFLSMNNTLAVLGRILEPIKKKQKKSDFSAFGEQIPLQKPKVEETQKKEAKKVEETQKKEAETEENTTGLTDKGPQRQRRKSQLVQGLANQMKPIEENTVGVFQEVPSNAVLNGKVPQRQRRKSQLVQGLANKTKSIQVNNAGVFDEAPLK